MFAFLKRTFVILVGFLLIFVFIWYAGPYFGFGPYHPLETPTARLIALGIVVGWWLLVRLVKRLRAYRASDRLIAAVAAQPQPEAARTPAEVVKLRERFDEAVAALKQQRRSGHSLYELPWYVIIGAPGSGKTTALLNSGLKFPLEQRVGKGALRGVGGTRNCDWWFTDEAIFLDTAGRYTTQDSDATSDSVGWTEFLALLRKYRARRPVNGVILTINAQDLIVQGAGAREAHVEAARSRLEELNRELRIQLPVYLMVTKCDLVDGFVEYFEDLSVEERAQVWGVTFPYEDSVSNESPEAYPAEFDALMGRLNERVFERIEEVRDTRRRTKIFAFPQQMAALREALTQFVTDVFANRQFNGQVLLRGVYFTSGTQEGTPIDRLLGSIGRRFGAAAAVMPSSGPGKAFFVERLLKEVMIGESGLAGINRSLETRKAAAQLGAYAATGVITAAGITVFTVSYGRNRDFLEQIGGEIALLQKLPTVNPQSPPERIVARLDAINGIVDSANRYRSNTTWTMSWGLYQGAAIGGAAQRAYGRELDSVLLPMVAARIRERMIQYSASPEKLFEYFKAYLMLGEPRKLDKDHVKALADAEWGPPAKTALTRHFHHLVDTTDTPRPLPLDGTLVAQARSSLSRTSVPKMVYDSVKREYAADPTLGLRIDQAVGLDVERVFRRRSGTPLSKPIPRLYTRDAFREITGVQGRAALLGYLQKDAWIWGEGMATSLATGGSQLAAVTALYEEDYIREWNALLDDLEFVFPPSVAETNEALRILTSPTSPLTGILRVIGDQTALVETKQASGSGGIIDNATKSVTDKLSKAFKPFQTATGAPTREPGMAVTTQFRWVRQLMSGEAGKTQLDAILQTLSEIQKQFDALGPDVAGQRPAQVLANPSFRTLLQQLRHQTSALPTGLRILVEQIAEMPEGIIIDAATKELEGLYDAQVVPRCRALIENHYPFGSTAMPDVKLDDFGMVFGHDGVFDKFFNEQMAKLVDASRSPWTWLPGGARPSRNILGQFETARRLRDMFFSPGMKLPQVKFGVTITDLDPTTSRFVLQIDGQNSQGHYQKPPVRYPVEWPGKTSGQAAASFEGRFYDPEAKNIGGPWAWFRLIDETMEGAPDAQQRIRLKVQNRHNQRAFVTVDAERAQGNPFATRDWRSFNCEP